MGFFDFLKQANINQGIEEYKNIKGLLVQSFWMYVLRRNIRKGIYQKVKMYRYNNLTMLFQ